MTLVNCYCSMNDIGERLGISDFDDDVTLEAAITSASRALDMAYGQFWYDAGSASARVFRPSSYCRALVDPFHTTTGLIIKTDDDDDGVFEVTWSASEYELDQFGGDMANMMSAPYDTIHGIDRTFPVHGKRRRTLEVTARWGWAAVPQSVHEASKILAVDLWKRKDVAFGIQTGTVEFGGLRIGRDLMAQVQSLMAPFNRVERTLGIA